MKIRCSVPGKAILMGEHAAVYGCPALVTAIDRRLRVELSSITPSDGEAGLRLVLPQLSIDDHRPWQSFVDYAEDRRRAWKAWSERPTEVAFQAVLGQDPAHLVRVAVGETLSRLGEIPDGGARLDVHSEIPLGSGFGSSAAAAVGIVTALLHWLGRSADSQLVQELALETERRQHGSPSGVDTATVFHGGVLWVEKEAAGLRIEPVDVRRPDLFDRFRVFHSGTPNEATGEVVAAVRELRERSPEAFDRELSSASRQTSELRALLERKPSDTDFVRIGETIRRFGGWLESIGVVPPGVKEAVRAVEAEGGAAKISGAGALTDPGAGSILVYHPQPDGLLSQRLRALPQLRSLRSLDLRFGASGVEVEQLD